MTAVGSMFPLFKARFFGGGGAAEPAAQEEQAAPPAPAAPAPPAAPKPGSLRQLDLRSLAAAVEPGPPTELRARAEKLAFFERQCSHVGGPLYVSAEAVARDRAALAAAGITHVVNCVSMLVPACFEGDGLRYLSLFLQDTPREDLAAVLYDVFDFVEAAAAGGGRVLIHCSQGVSRSVALACGYLMWRTRRGYDAVFADVKARRGVANPNIGFICQLLQWQKRWPAGGAPAAGECPRARVYRVAPHSALAPGYLVGKALPAAPGGAAALDERGAFVVHAPAGAAPGAGAPALFVWAGARAAPAYAAAAARLAAQLGRYEAAPAPVAVAQGAEPPAFWEALARGAAAGASPPSPPSPSSPRRVDAYDRDFEMYERWEASPRPAGAAPGAAAPPGARPPAGAAAEPAGCDSARGSGRKTPRAPAPEGALSPNDRLRKAARREAAERERRQAAAAAAAAAAGAGAPPPGRGATVPRLNLGAGSPTDAAQARAAAAALQRRVTSPAIVMGAPPARAEAPPQPPASARGAREGDGAPPASARRHRRGRGGRGKPAAQEQEQEAPPSARRASTGGGGGPPAVPRIALPGRK